jgi:hypothetical protein
MDQARGQPEFAQALGDGTKKDFDKMYAQLTEIQDKTADNIVWSRMVRQDQGIDC